MAKKATPNPKYTPAFKPEVLTLVANGEAIVSVAKKMSIRARIIPAWRTAEKKAKEDQTPTLVEEVEWLGGQLGQAERERNSLKKAVALFQSRRGRASEVKLIDAFIKEQGPDLPVSLRCNTAAMSKSSDYPYRPGVGKQNMTSSIESVLWEWRGRARPAAAMK